MTRAETIALTALTMALQDRRQQGSGTDLLRGMRQVAAHQAMTSDVAWPGGAARPNAAPPA